MGCNPVHCLKGAEFCTPSPYMITGGAVGRQQAILSPCFVLRFLQAQLEDAPYCNEDSSDDTSGDPAGSCAHSLDIGNLARELLDGRAPDGMYYQCPMTCALSRWSMRAFAAEGMERRRTLKDALSRADPVRASARSRNLQNLN